MLLRDLSPDLVAQPAQLLVGRVPDPVPELLQALPAGVVERGQVVSVGPDPLLDLLVGRLLHDQRQSRNVR